MCEIAARLGDTQGLQEARTRACAAPMALIMIIFWISFLLEERVWVFPWRRTWRQWPRCACREWPGGGFLFLGGLLFFFLLLGNFLYARELAKSFHSLFGSFAAAVQLGREYFFDDLIEFRDHEAFRGLRVPC